MTVLAFTPQATSIGTKPDQDPKELADRAKRFGIEDKPLLPAQSQAPARHEQAHIRAGINLLDQASPALSTLGRAQTCKGQRRGLCRERWRSERAGRSVSRHRGRAWRMLTPPAPRTSRLQRSASGGLSALASTCRTGNPPARPKQVTQHPARQPCLQAGAETFHVQTSLSSGPRRTQRSSDAQMRCTCTASTS